MAMIPRPQPGGLVRRPPPGGLQPVNLIPALPAAWAGAQQWAQAQEGHNDFFRAAFNQAARGARAAAHRVYTSWRDGRNQGSATPTPTPSPSPTGYSRSATPSYFRSDLPYKSYYDHPIGPENRPSYHGSLPRFGYSYKPIYKRIYNKYYKRKKMPYRKFPPTKKAYRRYMLKAPGPEIKFIDHAEDVNPLTTGSLFNVGPSASNTLCGAAQGDGPSDREGRKIKVIGIQFRGRVNTLVVTGGGSAVAGHIYGCRLILYQDRQCNGTAPTIINTNTGMLTAAGGNNFDSLPCMFTRGRFRFLKDKVWTLNPMVYYDGTTNHSVVTTSRFKFFKKLSIPIEFDNSATTGVLSTIRTNNINAVAFSEDDTVELECTIRTFFIDDC